MGPRQRLLITFAALCLLPLTVRVSLPRLPDDLAARKCFEVVTTQSRFCVGDSNYLQFSSIPESLRQSILIAEDASFFVHQGVDWHEVWESFKTNVAAGRFERGGSTITQQVVKNLFLSSEKSIVRKLKEAWLARDLEAQLTKQKIFELYVNLVETGPDLFGMQDAARFYFGCDAQDLSWFQSLYLVHLLPNPAQLSKGFLEGQLSDWSQDRLLELLSRLERYGKISDEDAQKVRNSIALAHESFAKLSDGEIDQEKGEQQMHDETQEPGEVEPDDISSSQPTHNEG